MEQQQQINHLQETVTVLQDRLGFEFWHCLHPQLRGRIVGVAVPSSSSSTSSDSPLALLKLCYQYPTNQPIFWNSISAVQSQMCMDHTLLQEAQGFPYTALPCSSSSFFAMCYRSEDGTTRSLDRLFSISVRRGETSLKTTRESLLPPKNPTTFQNSFDVVDTVRTGRLENMNHLIAVAEESLRRQEQVVNNLKEFSTSETGQQLIQSFLPVTTKQPRMLSDEEIGKCIRDHVFAFYWMAFHEECPLDQELL